MIDVDRGLPDFSPVDAVESWMSKVEESRTRTVARKVMNHDCHRGPALWMNDGPDSNTGDEPNGGKAIIFRSRHRFSLTKESVSDRVSRVGGLPLQGRKKDQNQEWSGARHAGAKGTED